MRTTRAKLPLSSDVTDKILCSMQEGLMIINGEDEIQTANKAALKILGIRSEDELVKRNLSTVFHVPSDAYEVLIELEKEKQLVQKEAILTTPGGQRLFCLLSASIVQDSSEGELLKVIIFQDITERKVAELQVVKYSEKLEKNNAELDQFAYIVSHDLKAPLRAITNLAQWLFEDLAHDISDENRRSLELLRSRAFRMEALINGILEYSRVGRSAVNTEVVDTKELVCEIIDTLGPAAPSKKTILSVSDPMPVLRTSRILLHQVFSNLISNAIKYNNKPEVLIEITAVEARDFIEFSIQDNGPGIPPEYHEKVFLIFQTLQARDKIEGTGIGLTIVKKIIEEQGGMIRIDKSSKTGARFVFTWPKGI